MMGARRALVVAPRLPEFDRESGLLRVYHLVDMLLDRGWEVTFGCLHKPIDPERYTRELEQRGVETHAPLESVEEIHDVEAVDLAILAWWRVAERFLPELRRAAPSARIVVDSVDLHFVREMRQRLGVDTRSVPGRLEAAKADRWIGEMNAYGAADAVLTVSEKEASLVNDLTGIEDLAMALPDAEELPRSPVPRSKRTGILFIGNFTHAPNRDAVSYLLSEILPLLDPSLLAEQEISIVGTAAEEHVGDLASGIPHVTVVGWVPSVIPYLQAARLSVVPLRYGAGTKRKLIQALMTGTPTVTSTVGAEGLGLRHEREALIADDAQAFASGIERLARRSLLWRGLARRGRAHMLSLHGRRTIESRFDRVLAEIMSRTPKLATEESATAPAAPAAPDYGQLVARVREAIQADLPRGSRVLVATKGDDALLALQGIEGWHFPRADDGRYAGFYPASSEDAISHLEDLRGLGATHLALPRTAFWWLASYADLHGHLAAAYKIVRSDENLMVFDLAGEPRTVAALPRQRGVAASGSNGNGRSAEAPDGAAPPAVEPETEITPQLIAALRPSPHPAALRHRLDDRSRRALVAGVYLAGKPNTAEDIVSILRRSEGVEVDQSWAALGGGPPVSLESVTSLTIAESMPKYALLNRLIAEQDLADYDFVLTVDDDIVLPEGFLDLFLGVQAGLKLDLAQPARTQNSHVDHPMVIQQRGVLARRTLFVEIGPVVSFARSAYDLLLPFDETNPMGWGFENVWAHKLREAGLSEGIVDAVPADHSVRAPVANYRWADAVADRERYLAANSHLPLEECFQVIDVVGIDR